MRDMRALETQGPEAAEQTKAPPRAVRQISVLVRVEVERHPVVVTRRFASSMATRTAPTNPAIQAA